MLATQTGNDMKRGSRGVQVSALQGYLNKVMGSNITIDGIFGGQTETLVKQFQSVTGVPNTGQIDSITWQALMTAFKTRSGGLQTPTVSVNSAIPQSLIPPAGEIEWSKVVMIGAAGIFVMKYLSSLSGRKHRKGTSYFGMDVG